MTSLAAYHRACSALAEAGQVSEVLAFRDEIEHVKLYARQIQDRALLADATEFQLRAERHLGRLLLAAKAAGELADKGQRGPKARASSDAPATLSEIGVERRLSAKAQKAAVLDQAAFEQIILGARDKIRSGRAIMVDPVEQASKQSELDQRRAAHATRTQGGCTVKDLGELALSGYRAGALGADPQWKFLAYSQLGDGRSAGTHYKTEELDRIKDLPVNQVTADDSALFIWVVDWFLHGALELIAHWGFTFKTVAFTWAKTNGANDGDRPLDAFADSSWHFGQGYWSRANPEMCLLATKGTPKRLHADVRQLIVAPLMEHSRKPDAWLERIERLVEGPYLELNARRRRPGWTAWGDELAWEGPTQEGAAA